MTFQLILPASGQANQKCVKIVTESRKPDLCTEQLNTLFQTFQGEEKFRQVTDTIQKPIKRETGGKGRERERETENRTTDTKKRMLPTLMDLITNLS